ncbi:MAG: hypothetical protein JWN23_3161 [Rhodocyclales bacterium]|nr:hypothetical protein [Rhodocyclales bacterium]
MRILLVSPISPYGQSAGGQLRTRLLMEALEEMGEVDILVLRQEDKAEPEFSALEPKGIQVALSESRAWHRRYTPRIELSERISRALPQPIADYDIIIGRYLWSICQLVIPAKVTSVVDLDDFDYRFSQASLMRPAVIKEWLQRRLSTQLARRQLSRFNAGFFVSERDRACSPALSSVLLPNVPGSIPAQAQRNPDGNSILFVGSMWYRPNHEAAEWFIAQVLPRIRARRPEAHFVIVGAAPHDLLARWAAIPGVEARGYVDSLADTYASAGVVVAPIQSGGGTNIKILEALAYACPCVTNRFSHSAFSHHLQPGQHLLVANDANAFAEACLQMLAEPGRGNALGQAAREQIIHHYDPTHFREQAQAFLRTTLANRS